MALARAIFSVRKIGIKGVHWSTIGADEFYGRRNRPGQTLPVVISKRLIDLHHQQALSQNLLKKG
jgi:hypothetical protein